MIERLLSDLYDILSGKKPEEKSKKSTNVDERYLMLRSGAEVFLNAPEER